MKLNKKNLKKLPKKDQREIKDFASFLTMTDSLKKSDIPKAKAEDSAYKAVYETKK